MVLYSFFHGIFYLQEKSNPVVIGSTIFWLIDEPDISIYKINRIL